jgi:hypothetical protein
MVVVLVVFYGRLGKHTDSFARSRPKYLDQSWMGGVLDQV